MTTESHIWHPYTRFSEVESLPEIVSGEGLYLTDQNGKRYLDGISSWWCCNLGHCHPRLTAAIQQQATQLHHSILGGLSHPGARVLSSELAALFPTSPRHVLFASDGSSSIEASLKTLVSYHYYNNQPERTLFACLEEPYHGDTIGSVSVGYMSAFHRPVKSLLFEALQIPVAQSENDSDAYQRATHLLTQNAHRLAGLVVEPICQGTAGIRIYPASYLQHLADTCKALSIPLIVDEIAMGYGRTGKMFAQEWARIDPEIITLGKGITGGSLPLSAAVVKDTLYETFSDTPENRTFFHGHTFGGNPLACAAALEVLAIYRETRLLEYVAEQTSGIEEAIQVARTHPRIVKGRHLGAIAVLELDALSAEEGLRLRVYCREAGLLIRPLGPVVYLMLPLIASRADWELALGILLDQIQRV